MRKTKCLEGVCFHRFTLFGFVPLQRDFVFRLSACPGATGFGYAMVSLAYGCLIFHSLILTCQVWARDALFFSDNRLTNPDIPLVAGRNPNRLPKTGCHNTLKNVAEPSYYNPRNTGVFHIEINISKLSITTAID